MNARPVLALALILLACIAQADEPPRAGYTGYLPLVTQPGPAWPIVAYDKKGAGDCTCAELDALGARFGRAWQPVWQTCASGAVRVPELHGPEHWNADSAAAVAGSGWLLGANEADQTASIAEHVAAHAEWYEPACQPPCRLGSPATSQFGGVAWLRAWYAAFVAQYGRPPRLDFLDMHCYLTPEYGADECIAELHSLEQFGNEIDVPWIVVSETGWPPREYWSRIEAWAEAQAWLDVLEADDRVLWVSLFSCRVDEDAAWAGALPQWFMAGWNWNELFSPGGLITWDGRQWAAWPGE